MARKIIRLVPPLVMKAESAQRSNSKVPDTINRLVYKYRTSESNIANEVDPKCPGIRERMKEVACLALISEQGVQIENLPTCNKEKHVSGSVKLVMHSRISGGSPENWVAV